MSEPVDVPDTLTTPVTFEWNGRTWVSLTNAIEAHEMFVYLRGTFFPFDSEGAYNYALNGGTFDMTRSEMFFTYYVHKQSGGLVRLFRANDTRELRDGQTW